MKHRNLSDISEIIVHCSDSDRKAHDNIDTIRSWHVDSNNWSDIGYHFVITADGVVHIGRKLDVVGAHCYGRNRRAVGICLTGKWKFTDNQYIALAALCLGLKASLRIENKDINPHNRFDPVKTCPNFNLDHLMRVMKVFEE